jgi:hypothetical protein
MMIFACGEQVYNRFSPQKEQLADDLRMKTPFRVGMKLPGQSVGQSIVDTWDVLSDQRYLVFQTPIEHLES